MSGHEHRDDAGAKLGMWLFLFTEILLFGGLFILYAVYLQRYPAAFSAGGKQLDLFFGTLNTFVLITSSLFVAMAVTSIQRAETRLTLFLLGGTVLSAAFFLVNKYIEWSQKFHHGIWPGSPAPASAPPGESVFFGLYFLTTGLHGLHVFIGGIVLAWVGARVRTGAVNAERFILLENGALYWHLVDLIWIFIFPLYYLIL